MWRHQDKPVKQRRARVYRMWFPKFMEQNGGEMAMLHGNLITPGSVPDGFDTTRPKAAAENRKRGGNNH